MFLTGNTEDFHGMIRDLTRRFPNTKIICIGFSMGGNLITKYLGEAKRDNRILAGVSVCQGYEANEFVLLLYQFYPMKSKQNCKILERPIRCFFGMDGGEFTFTS
jgi:predicted alpha/beta-fold hydrolase